MIAAIIARPRGGRRISEIKDELGDDDEPSTSPCSATRQGLAGARSRSSAGSRRRPRRRAIDDRGTVFNQDVLGAIELGYMLDCAETIVVGAIERKESRGAQFRTDYPERDDAQLAQAHQRLASTATARRRSPTRR